jgi:hypothetical protein
MAHWMDVPDLEMTLQQMNQQPAAIGVLRSAVNAIAAALERPVTTAGDRAMVTFQYPGLAFYNVRVQADEYLVRLQHEAAQLELIYGYTDELAWRICGYPCSPAEMRGARKRAAAEGITDQRLPPQFFRPRRRQSERRDAS